MTSIENKPRFVYVTYIASTPQKVWDALTSAETSKQFWSGYSIHSSWEVGSPISLRNPEGVETDDGVVLAFEPTHLLSYTFHPYADPAYAAEEPSRVTFKIEPSGETVKLTLTHEGFGPESKVFPAISLGWPMIMASLKTLLESGSILKLGAMESGEA